MVAAVLRTWQADVKADVLTARLLIVFIDALQLAAALIAALIVWSRRRRCGRSGGAREPPLPLSQACEPGEGGEDNEDDETEGDAARESCTESGFIGKCSLYVHWATLQPTLQ